MRRIFLLIDDYVELTFLETILKKVGFDTVGYQGVVNASDKALAMLPDLIILSDIIKGIPTHDSLMQIKKMRPQMKCLLLRRDFSLTLEHDLKLIDLTLKSPIDPLDFLKHVCRILQVEVDSVSDKFVKLGLFRGAEAEKYIKVQGQSNLEANKSSKVMGHSNLDADKFTKVQGHSNLDAGKSGYLKTIRALQDQPVENRESRYKTQVEGLPEPEATGIDHKMAIKEMQELRSRSKDVEIQKIDEERQAFVKSLFKK